jgi:hypothetical protein
MPQSLHSITDLVAQSQQKELDLVKSLQETLTDADRARINAEISAEKAKRVEYMDVMKQTTELQSTYSTQVDTASAQQRATMELLDKQIAHANVALAAMDDTKNNKKKMVQINTYFGKQYESYTSLAIVFCIFLILLLIPNLVANLLQIPELAIALRKIIWWVGGLYLAYRSIDVVLRRNDNYDEYTWPVAPRTTDELKTANEIKGQFVDISGVNIPNLCLGEYCCGPGTDWTDGSGCTSLE